MQHGERGGASGRAYILYDHEAMEAIIGKFRTLKVCKGLQSPSSSTNVEIGSQCFPMVSQSSSDYAGIQLDQTSI